MVRIETTNPKRRKHNFHHSPKRWLYFTFLVGYLLGFGSAFLTLYQSSTGCHDLFVSNANYDPMPRVAATTTNSSKQNNTNDETRIIIQQAQEENPLPDELEFDLINKRLNGHGRVNTVDYPAVYTKKDIEDSVHFSEQHQEVIVPYVTRIRQQQEKEAGMQCKKMLTAADVAQKSKVSSLESGGWCLEANKKNKYVVPGTSIVVPINHAFAPSGRVVKELSILIQEENVQSINDFGAGVGQYKAAVKAQHPNIEYHAYDGAGNIVEYTNGFVEFFDLTYPLELPKAEWVLSLEVGEHIPSPKEGMFVRNLHRHNTKGIILSWGTLGQQGFNHVNTHSNEYIIQIFESLGYTFDKSLSNKFRNPKDNFYWFEESVMVFRR